MKQHPYSQLPKHCFWSRGVADQAGELLDPMTAAPFLIGRQDKVATAGSCFAQHIARHLRAAGFHFLVTEAASPMATEQEASAYNYGTFSARYGNLYTARQLLQLYRRAYGQLVPGDTVWRGAGGAYIDPFRPAIQPGGFASREELLADRAQHLRAVRAAFESLDVLVLTLGLTEAWEAAADGVVFPLCPAVVADDIDAGRYRLRNFRVAEVVDDMLAFIDLLRAVNPGARIVLTVSPVPLAATGHADQHVLSATTYSKSVLRAACGEISGARPLVAYMPSYEIITGSHARGRYFADDLRSVTEAGVRHVMRVFLQHFAGLAALPPTAAALALAPAADAHAGAMQELVKANCDEEVLLRAAPRPPTPACNLCGGLQFGPGPGGRMAQNGDAPCCLQCGALERHRSVARVLQSLPGDALGWRRALLAGAEQGADRRWFAASDQAPLEELAGNPAIAAGYDFISVVYGLEFVRHDREQFDLLYRMLTPKGLMAICFIAPDERAATARGLNDEGRAQQPYQLYGADLAEHFGCGAKDLATVAVDSADPCSGSAQRVHLFFRDHGEASAYLAACR
jgi:hypothetical protein